MRDIAVIGPGAIGCALAAEAVAVARADGAKLPEDIGDPGGRA